MLSRRLLLTLPAVLALMACRPGELPGGASASAFKGIDITGAEYARRLDLPDPTGRERHLEEFRGKVLVVFFGYTQCPDVCPTTLAELAAARQQLGAEGERVQGLFVSLDPERDTPEVLGPYVDSFKSGFVALRGTLEQTKAAAQEFKVFYAKVPGKTDQSYTVDHTAGAYLFDAQGRVRVFSRYGAGVDTLVHDLKALLAQG